MARGCGRNDKVGRSGGKRAFTLVELLIVVLILGILAMIVLPKFSNAARQARGSMLADDLRVMRTQLQVFKGQHLGVPPGHPNCDRAEPPTSAVFAAQMTTATNASGVEGMPGTPGFFGPYFRELPVDPLNDLNSVEIILENEVVPGAADGTTGWIYQPSTLIFVANAVGSDEVGTSYIDY